MLGIVALAGCMMPSQGKAYSQPDTKVERNALDFDRYELTDPKAIDKLKQSDNYNGLAGIDGWGITGWFEYDFTVNDSGWYEFRETLTGGSNNVEFIFDPQLHDHDTDGIHIYGAGAGFNGTDDKLGNIWLAAGSHTLRIQQYYWTGFPNITRISIRPSPATLAGSIRAELPDLSGVYRTNECPELDLVAGSSRMDYRLIVLISDKSTGAIRNKQTISIPSSRVPQKLQIPLYCDNEGIYSISYQDAAGRAISNRDVREISYEVINTKKRPRVGGDVERKLLQEIDCVSKPPDYKGGGETRVVRKSFGSYRESGDADWRQYQQLKPALRALRPEPSWFAYKLMVNHTQRPYLVEVDYPDDALRSMAIVLRESVPLNYPVAGGVDTGGEFSLSNTMQTHSMIFWPRAADPRIVFMNARQGSHAAAAKIRVYELNGDFPALRASEDGGRNFINWYEEGGNFTSLYGVDASPGNSSLAIERWAESVGYMGGNMLSPTINIYNFCLYPSSYNLAFSEPPGNDVFRRMLLIAEKHQMKVLPDFHPRADELAWPYAGSAVPKPNLLLSKDGKQPGNLPPPYYNPLYPANQDWYVNMLGEFADKYKDSPALLGVSLRLMQWANPTLNNFQSLDWGYDDYTTDLFQKETGITIPDGVKNDGRYRRRYDWLMANARDKWINWRCEKIAQLHERIRNRVRQARPDLKVYSVAYDAYPSEYGPGWLRDAGIDVGMLSNIDGVVLINGLHAYGRLYDDITTQGTRDNLLDPAVLRALMEHGDDGKFLSYARYFEATEAVVPPGDLGFDASTKKTWTSAVVNPSGRHFLERYAVELAETDATILGDGGNGYTLGQPLLREFLGDYRLLPAEHFTPRQDASDPVAVWELARNSDYLFYAVNRERYTVDLSIKITGTDEVTRLSTGERKKVSHGVLEIQLKPYQLMAFRTQKIARIDSVATEVPAGSLDIVNKQVSWLESLNKKITGNLTRFSLSSDQKQVLRRLAADARSAIDQGRAWQARGIVENHELLKIYVSINDYPPGFRNARLEEK
jgi:Glycosyl hydrolase-like 10